MDRRAFLGTLAGGLLAALLAAEGQQGKVWRIGVLTASVVEAGHPIAAFRQQLRELGYVEGQNVTLEIVGSGRGSVEAAQLATTSIPIVMVIAADPVGSGFMASLARPGGNITGLTVQYTDVAGKRLQLLKEAVPNLARVAVVLESGGFPAARRSVSEADAAAATALGLQLQAVEVRSPSDLDGASRGDQEPGRCSRRGGPNSLCPPCQGRATRG